MLPEKVKLALLIGSYVVCVGSLFTSHKSFQMGPRDLPILKPQVNRFCTSVFKARNKCRKNANATPECSKINQQSTQCESAVKHAYKKINGGGCPFQLRDVTLCELERCGGYHGVSVLESQNDSNNRNAVWDSVEGCMHHCDAVRKQLDKCVVDKVERQLKKYGIQIQQR